MPLNLVLYLAMQIVVPLAGFGGTVALSKRKNRKMTLPKAFVSLMFPVIGIAWSLAERKHPPQGRTPEEQEVFNARFSVDDKKQKLEKLQSRQDKLSEFKSRSLFYRVRHPLQWFSGSQMKLNERFIKRTKGDLVAEYEMLGRAERKANMSGRDRFVAVRKEQGPQGLRFGIPYDASMDVVNEIKFLIAQQFGVDINNPDTFFQSEHRAADMGGYRPGRSVLAFDTKEHRLSPLGAEMPDEQFKRVKRIMTQQCKRLVKSGLMESNGARETRDLLTIEPIGKESVALNYNGVCLAYAVAGPDGVIRTMGHDVKADDKRGLKMASTLNERFRGVNTIEGWIDKAEKMVMSDSNFESARLGQAANRTHKQRIKEKAALRRQVLYAPRSSRKAVSKGIKK